VSDYSPGSFGCQEALHLTRVIADLVEEQIEHHPAINRNADWKMQASAICMALFKLHNDIAAVHRDRPTK
jgi:hypothetical protein